MHSHWFTLRNYWERLSPRLLNARITRIFTYEKNLCTFILLTGRDRYRVDYAGSSELPYCVLQSELNIPRRKVPVLEEVRGADIQSIRMIPSDRVLSWQFTGGSRLLFEFYGRVPNVYFVDESYHILASFKDRGHSERIEFREFTGFPYPLPDNFPDQFEAALGEYSRKSARNALASLLPHWTSLLARESLSRANLNENAAVSDLTPEHVTALSQAIIDIMKDLEATDAYISSLPTPVFSLVPLHHRENIQWDSHLPIEEAYPGFIGEFYRGKRFRSLQTTLKRAVGSRIERAQRRKEKQEADLRDWKDPAVYRKFADLLMAQGQQAPRERDNIELQDIIDTQEQITIPLQPNLSVIENAQKYYEKAKKSSRGQGKLQEQIQQTEQDILAYSELLESIENASELETLEEFNSQLKKQGITTRTSQAEEPLERKPYIEYVSPDGWRILVGRAAKDNDELTFHLAHKEDFWFHAEHVPGSHVIAMPDNKNLRKPPPATLKFAASLAAGYSQAKHSSLVPVVYTKRKYVTKPRDAGPGQVRYQFEESVMVKPRTK
ncbi:MAG TPA: NFACT family protein [bacterium]|nr:NFACT family protein [bacterium]